MGAGTSVLQRSVLLLKKHLDESGDDGMPDTEELVQVESAAITTSRGFISPIDFNF